MTAMSAFPPVTAQTERQWAFSREFLARRIGIDLHLQYPTGSSQDQRDKLVERYRERCYADACMGHARAERMEREERIRLIDEELDHVLGPVSKRERVLEQ